MPETRDQATGPTGPTPPAAMLRTVEAVVEKDGRFRFLEPVDLREGERALVTLLGDAPEPDEAARLSEAALAADWDRPEEDEAWGHLQP